ncbi:MAG: aminotransferase class V-fold PLP-dependent enzyme, partial [Janthinobacterium lividum]
RLRDGVLALEGVRLNGANARRIPHTLSLTIARDGFFPFQLADALAVSSTSACSAAAGVPSHVLSALGLDAVDAGRTVRLSLGRFTSDADVDVAVAALRRCVACGA